MRALVIVILAASVFSMAQQQPDLKQVEAKAEAGDPAAQSDLGYRYLTGDGVEKDAQQSFQWYRKASEQGYAPALYSMGTAYYNGDGVAVDDGKSYIYFMFAKHAGYARAQDAVQRAERELNPRVLRDAKLFAAQVLLSGKDVPADPGFAIEIYKGMSDAGDPIAEVRLARFYILGQVVNRDKATAQQLCEKAAKNGFTPGMVCLGYLDQSSELGTPSYDESIRWYKRAAERENPVAMFSLASMYAQGLGVKQDKVKASAWILRAAQLHLGTAVDIANRLKAHLPAKEFKAAEQQARVALVEHPNPPASGHGTIMVLDNTVMEFPLAPRFPEN